MNPAEKGRDVTSSKYSMVQQLEEDGRHEVGGRFEHFEIGQVGHLKRPRGRLRTDSRWLGAIPHPLSALLWSRWTDDQDD
jgi:hypothetical protein